MKTQEKQQQINELLSKMKLEKDFARHYDSIDEAIYCLIMDRLNYNEANLDQAEVLVEELTRENVRHLLTDLFNLQTMAKQLRQLDALID